MAPRKLPTRPLPSPAPMRTATICLAILISIIGQLAGPLAKASAEAKNAPASVEAGQVSAQPLPNFHQVHPFLYRGGQPNNEGVEKLKAIGVKTVIDLRAETKATREEKAHLQKLGMHYIDLPMSNAAPTQAQVDTFLETVKQGKEKNEPVFVHCAHGSDRTGCMVGIWRVTEDGYSYDKAYKEMRQYYFGPQFTNLSQAVKKRASN